MGWCLWLATTWCGWNRHIGTTCNMILVTCIVAKELLSVRRGSSSSSNLFFPEEYLIISLVKGKNVISRESPWKSSPSYTPAPPLPHHHPSTTSPCLMSAANKIGWNEFGCAVSLTCQGGKSDGEFAKKPNRTTISDLIMLIKIPDQDDRPTDRRPGQAPCSPRQLLTHFYRRATATVDGNRFCFFGEFLICIPFPTLFTLAMLFFCLFGPLSARLGFRGFQGQHHSVASWWLLLSYPIVNYVDMHSRPVKLTMDRTR